MKIHNCLVTQYPYGTSLRLLYGGLDVTFTAGAENFRIEAGTDNISQLGYDRTLQKSTDAQAEASLLGSPMIKGVPYGQKYEMSVRLRNLSDTQLETTMGIIERSHADGALVTLYDQRQVTREPTPRTRAKVGTVVGAPTIAGMDFYYAQYRVWVTQWSEPYRTDRGLSYLDFAAIEIGRPIAPGSPNDLP